MSLVLLSATWFRSLDFTGRLDAATRLIQRRVACAAGEPPFAQFMRITALRSVLRQQTRRSLVEG